MAIEHVVIEWAAKYIAGSSDYLAITSYNEPVPNP